MNNITVVCTSCGRWNLLHKTISSFICNIKYPIEDYIVIDNSTHIDSEKRILECFPTTIKPNIIVNPINIGQVASLDIGYSLVKTPYIFQLEDDWEFFNYSNRNFIEDSLYLLNYDKSIMNINIRVRNDGTKGSEHPVVNLQEINGIKWLEYVPYYFGVYHGFSWNPGLRRLEDYKKIGNFKYFVNEEGMNSIYHSMGYHAVCLQDSYCHHIGENSETVMRNQ